VLVTAMHTDFYAAYTLQWSALSPGARAVQLGVIATRAPLPPRVLEVRRSTRLLPLLSALAFATPLYQLGVVAWFATASSLATLAYNQWWFGLKPIARVVAPRQRCVGLRAEMEILAAECTAEQTVDAVRRLGIEVRPIRTHRSSLRMSRESRVLLPVVAKCPTRAERKSRSRETSQN